MMKVRVTGEARKPEVDLDFFLMYSRFHDHGHFLRFFRIFPEKK
jgi:hypothetical protein